MRKFIVEKGLVLPLDRANVDTDFISNFSNPSRGQVLALIYLTSTAIWTKESRIAITLNDQ